MATPGEARRPVSLWIAVIGSAISGVAVIAFGIASITADHAAFSWGIGAMLVGYGLLMLGGSWLGWRRHLLARGLIVAPALLNTAIAASLMTAGDLPQTIGAVAATVVFVATIVGAVLPSTHRALRRRPSPA